MIEIEPAQEILVCLPRSAVLRDDESRHEFQNLPRPEDGPILHELPRDPSCARGVGGPDGVLVVPGYLDLLLVFRTRIRMRVPGIGLVGRVLCTSKGRNEHCKEQGAAAPSRAAPGNGRHELSPNWTKRSGRRICW